MYNGLTDVPGIKVGHWTDLEAATGCTVVLCPEGAVAGVDVRGTAPGTRETDLLDPVCMVDQVHAILIGGGSAYGLAAASGVMRWLEQRSYGFNTGVARVPIVPAAILFDLAIGRADVRPGTSAGCAACDAATSGVIPQGNVGAGTGATAGKALGFDKATKTGLGTASHIFGDGVVVAALVAANPFGDIYDPKTQQIIAGTRLPNGQGFADTFKVMGERGTASEMQAIGHMTNTTLAVIATNVQLNKPQVTKLAQMAQDALPRVMCPVHTHFDGDTIFTLSYGDKKADLNLLGTIAVQVLTAAIINAVHAAESLHGIPAAKDLV